MTPIKLTGIQLDGVSGSNALAGEQVTIITRAAITSDHSEFYGYMEGLGNLISGRAAAAGQIVILDSVSALMLVIHPDNSGDLYLDGPPRMMQVMAKRDVATGEAVTRAKIADVRSIEFPDLTLSPDDKIIVCFKVGWKFALFFDLGRQQGELDVSAMGATLAHLYRVLMFQDAYEALSDRVQFDTLVGAGWFPFIEIMGGEFELLSRAHRTKFNVDGQQDGLIAKLTNERIDDIAKRWWNRPSLAPRRGILEPALEAYKRGDWVLSIKTLLTEIEGIVRDAHIVDVGSNAPVKDLLQYAIDQGVKKSGGETSLFFPKEFLKYLRQHTFGHFDPIAQTGVLDARHGVSHGAAKAEAYTQARALQAILTIDQIGFYL